VLSYEDLLELFWTEHEPRRNKPSRQYSNAVFYRDSRQREAAEDSKTAAAAQLGVTKDRVETLILPVRSFTYAEMYHQKYMLTRHRELREFLSTTYPGTKALADSTVASRLNAYLFSGRPAASVDLEEEIAGFDLPSRLLEQVTRFLSRP